MAKQEKLARLCKEKMADEIVARFKNKPNFLITSYMGSSASDLERLRRSLKKNSADYFVVKNSILRVVFDRLNLKDEISKIDAGIGISLSGDDVIATCKTLVDFSKTHDKFKIKGAVIDGQSLATDRVKTLACLPPRDILIAMVIGGIRAPITGFVNVLGGVLRKFIYVVDAIKTKKGVEAPKVEEPKKEELK